MISDQQERYYNIFKLNKWFAISSILFTAFWILTFADDYNRPWKKYQIEFRQMEIEKIRNEISVKQEVLEGDDNYQQLLLDLDAKQLELNSKEEKIFSINDELNKIQGAVYSSNQNYQFSKADLDAVRYQLEESRFGHGDEKGIEKKYNKLVVQTEKAFLISESYQIKVDSLESILKELNASLRLTNDDLFKLTKDRDLLERQLSKLDPEAMSFSNKIANIVRDLPVIDFIDPFYDVKQVVVNDLKEDLVYMGMPKVDRCMTCHVGIDKKGFEEAPQPYTTHPRLDEFVGGSSPHPMSEYGCTSCHGGRGRGTDFISSGHMPRDLKQKKEWKKKYNWDYLHYWEDKMLPVQYAEAGCFKCHGDNMPVKGAPVLSLGMSTFEKAGCYSCHQMDRWADAPKPGPSLYKMASKIEKDWTYRWIMEPRAFRHNTWMQHFFKKGNNSSSEDIIRTEQETLAMVEFLFDKSDNYDQKNKPFSGNPDNGSLLVSSYGCMGCHQIQPEADPDYEPSLQNLRIEQGPNLIGLGSKTNEKWLFNWLKNPYSYHPGTKMPNLRLSDQEASDIAAYLIQSTSEEFDQTMVPDVNEKIINEITSDFLSQLNSSSQVSQKLDEMSIEEKLVY